MHAENRLCISLIALTAEDCLQSFRRKTVDEDKPPCRIYVSRIKGEFASDVLSFYKGRSLQLAATPLVRYEGESGVGSGPRREYFSLVMQMLEAGFQTGNDTRKMIFEGEDDHKLPVKDPLLRQTGMFVAAGKMIAHASLHGVPPLLYGVSPAVIYYWTHDDCLSTDDKSIGLTLHLNDVPDLTLRESLQKVFCCNINWGKAPCSKILFYFN